MSPGWTFEPPERAKGFEPSTPTLARSCSTPELHPHPRSWRRWVRRQRAELCQMRPMNATTVEVRNLRLARTVCQRLGKAPKKPEIRLAAAVRPDHRRGQASPRSD